MEQLNFNDIIQNSALQMTNGSLSLLNVGINLLITFVLGIFIYAVYKRTFKGVLYSKGYNVILVMMAMITSIIIMAISSNIVLSLGMVGALSIIRFRTAIKDPVDIAFMFWAISVGIVSGAGLYSLAVLGSLIIGMVMFILTRYSYSDNPYLLVANCSDDQSEELLFKKLKEYSKNTKIKSKTVNKNNIELTIELREQRGKTSFVNELLQIDGVKNAVLVSYDGDYVS
ncbi:MAG: DUF4956 domain-containing protein [Firmicutes bacterium]|nr:DUF4956 domain-containing protein [Bacillota bacterium]